MERNDPPLRCLPNRRPVLNRDFPSDEISFLLLDARSGAVLASRWDHPETPIPLGSLLKPFTALAYGELHEFKYPAHICRGTATGCWRPRGTARQSDFRHCYSCNSYFRVLTASMTAADVTRLQPASAWSRLLLESSGCACRPRGRNPGDSG